MRIIILGGHGKIALLLGQLLVAGGHSVAGVVRNPDHAADLEAIGVEPVVLDLETADVAALAAVLRGADTVVFAAGAGPGSSRERKRTVDEGASNLGVAAALEAGVARFLLISAMGTDDPPADDSVFSHYLRAKSASEQKLRDSTLDAVILRPGRLTDEPATHRVHLADSVARGSVTRADVAAVIMALLEQSQITDRTLELVAGTDSITAAIEQCLD